ncbi:MAG: DMT family transporter [Alphaproteobacteria bacterium]
MNAERASLAPMPNPIAGVLWMVVSAVCFATMTTFIRPASEHLHPLQVLFFRNCIGLAAMTPWLLRAGVGALRTRHLGRHVLRACLVYGAMATWFYVTPKVALVDAVAISFTAPFFTTAIAVFALGEVVRWRRWTAIAAGFGGALLILRPGFAVVDPLLLLIFVNAVTWAGAVVLIKILSRTDSANAIVALMFVLLVPMSFPAALYHWQDPSWIAFPFILGVGLAGVAGHYCATRAISLASTSLVMPIEYLRLPVLGLIGFLFFAEVPDNLTLTGAAIIVSASLYIGHREARRERAESATNP